MDHGARGETALNTGKYTDAVSHYTKAITASPEGATYYLKRSIAFQRLARYDAALHDAENAVNLATKRAKREMIAQGQLRRGIALYFHERFGDASYCLALARELDEKEKSAAMWEDKAKLKLKDLAEDDVRREVTVVKVPEFKAAEAVANEKVKDAATTSVSASDSVTTAAPPSASTTPPTQTQTPLSKIRHDWYQTNTHVYLNIMAKGVSKDQASIEISSHSVSINFPTSAGSAYDFTLDPLFAPIDASASKFRVLSTKIEIVLLKQLMGQKWSALEGSASASGNNEDDGEAKINNSARGDAPSSTPKPPAATLPSPYVSRPGSNAPKNWDTIANTSLKAARAADTKPDAKSPTDSKGKPSSTADLDEDDEDGDDVNKFFKHLFKNADPDTRKAMVKSYTESGGTALSTNWEDVKKKKVEISPPEGLEAKEWEY